MNTHENMSLPENGEVIKGTEYPKIAGPINLPVLLPGEIIADFRLYLFAFRMGSYYVLEKGDVNRTECPLVRVQSACNIAHIFNSQRCDCRPQLELAMRLIHDAGKGVLIYGIHHEGRGIGSFDHVRVYQKQDDGFDTVDSYVELGLPIDPRDYSGIDEILQWFNLKEVLLLTNDPRKIDALEKMGLKVQRMPLVVKTHKYNQSQVRPKVEKLGHLIPLTETENSSGDEVNNNGIHGDTWKTSRLYVQRGLQSTQGQKSARK